MFCTTSVWVISVGKCSIPFSEAGRYSSSEGEIVTIFHTWLVTELLIIIFWHPPKNCGYRWSVLLGLRMCLKHLSLKIHKFTVSPLWVGIIQWIILVNEVSSFLRIKLCPHWIFPGCTLWACFMSVLHYSE